MHSKLVLYVLALLTGLAVGPQAAAGAAKGQPVEQCAAASGAEANASVWFAELSETATTKKPADTVPKAKVAPTQRDDGDCTGGTPVKRQDAKRE